MQWGAELRAEHINITNSRSESTRIAVFLQKIGERTSPRQSEQQSPLLRSAVSWPFQGRGWPVGDDMNPLALSKQRSASAGSWAL